MPSFVPWLFPLPGRPHLTTEDGSWTLLSAPWVGVPKAPHPGAFGVPRAHHCHEGVDLYAPEGTPVSCVEAGRVVAIEAFTGPLAQSPWWLDTQAVLVEGASGVVVYGELVACVEEGQWLETGARLGHLVPVLRHDKGRPRTMLHLELHAPGTRASVAWEVGAPRPPSLQDPTALLIQAQAHE